MRMAGNRSERRRAGGELLLEDAIGAFQYG
jgi:hypothetical protein